MRRVVQRTITTTKIISLTITHSEEEVEYTLSANPDQLSATEPALPDESTAAMLLDAQPDRSDSEAASLGAGGAVDAVDVADTGGK